MRNERFEHSRMCNEHYTLAGLERQLPDDAARDGRMVERKPRLLCPSGQRQRDNEEGGKERSHAANPIRPARDPERVALRNAACTDDESTWPATRDLKTFRRWFRVDIHSVVVDVADDDIEGEAL